MNLSLISSEYLRCVNVCVCAYALCICKSLCLCVCIVHAQNAFAGTDGVKKTLNILELFDCHFKHLKMNLF